MHRENSWTSLQQLWVEKRHHNTSNCRKSTFPGKVRLYYCLKQKLAYDCTVFWSTETTMSVDIVIFTFSLSLCMIVDRQKIVKESSWSIWTRMFPLCSFPSVKELLSTNSIPVLLLHLISWYLLNTTVFIGNSNEHNSESKWIKVCRRQDKTDFVLMNLEKVSVMPFSTKQTYWTTYISTLNLDVLMLCWWYFWNNNRVVEKGAEPIITHEAFHYHHHRPTSKNS